MLEGMKRISRGSALPFVSTSYGQPSTYVWEDAVGKVHTITQGEGGEQGDAMMPLLFSLGQHPALQRVQAQLREGEYLLAFLDDIYMVTLPERACEVHGFVEEALWSVAGIRVHQGKTQMWNQAGVEPPGCHRLQAEAVLSDPTAVVWRGAEELARCRRGMKVLGTPLGHSEYIQAQLEMQAIEHQTLLDRISLIEDVQSAWSIFGPLRSGESQLRGQSSGAVNSVRVL